MELPNITILDEKDKRLHQRSEEVTFPLDDEMIKTIKNTMRCHYNIVGLIDDNPNKMNYAISGIKILGNRYDIANICRQNNIDIIFFSISNIDSKNKK